VGVVRIDGHELDSASLELGPQCADLVLVEVVLERERLERRLVERAEILGVVEEGPGIDFQQVAQLIHSFVFSRAPAAYGTRSSFVTGKNDVGQLGIPSPDVKILQIP
jgi:hypothetical protein